MYNSIICFIHVVFDARYFVSVNWYNNTYTQRLLKKTFSIIFTHQEALCSKGIKYDITVILAVGCASIIKFF